MHVHLFQHLRHIALLEHYYRPTDGQFELDSVEGDRDTMQLSDIKRASRKTPAVRPVYQNIWSPRPTLYINALSGGQLQYVCSPSHGQIKHEVEVTCAKCKK